MSTARLHVDTQLPAAAALARGAALLEGVGSERPVLLYGAELGGAAIVLGAHQHAPHALRAEALDLLALPVLRRRSGGAAVWAGQGLLYFALGLRDASTLMACPKGKLLNRNVRGLLAGLRSLPVPAHYFGRDFVSFTAEPGAYIGWDEAPDGRVLLECFVALDTPFTLPAGLSGYPERAEPALRGKTPTTLRAAGARQSGREVLFALAEGYARGWGLEVQADAPAPEELARAAELAGQFAVDLRAPQTLSWSEPHEDAIGFVSAGLQLDGAGRIAAARVGGDFYQRQRCGPELSRRLAGAAPTPESVGQALDAVYAVEPGAIEGVRSLNTLRSALLDAAQRAARRT